MDAPTLSRDQNGTSGLPPSRRPAFDGCPLSARELDTLRRLARGATCAEVAHERGGSVSTVRSLLHNAYRRLGVTTRAQAIAVCNRAGWLDVMPDDGKVVDLADRRVTWAQRLYLEAFDQSLRAGDDPAEVARTRALRDAALTGVFREIGTERPWRVMGPAHPLERIACTLQYLDARADRRPGMDQVSDCPTERCRTAAAR